MILGLKIALIVYGVIGILDGLVLIFNPHFFANIWGFGEMAISDFGVTIAPHVVVSERLSSAYLPLIDDLYQVLAFMHLSVPFAALLPTRGW